MLLLELSLLVRMFDHLVYARMGISGEHHGKEELLGVLSLTFQKKTLLVDDDDDDDGNGTLLVLLV